jgi:hypothetical protein
MTEEAVDEHAKHRGTDTRCAQRIFDWSDLADARGNRREWIDVSCTELRSRQVASTLPARSGSRTILHHVSEAEAGTVARRGY